MFCTSNILFRKVGLSFVFWNQMWFSFIEISEKNFGDHNDAKTMIVAPQNLPKLC